MQHDLFSREFQPSDLPEITALMGELGYPTTLAEMTVRMEHISSNSDYRTLVVVKEREVVGMVGMMRCWFWEQNGFYVKIQALVVKSTARRMGVGEHLVGCAESWARSIGASAIFLNSGNKEERKAAHAFYPRMGFEHKSSGYVKQLHP
jgi:GNAT superfamily N-acetyltransferase